MEQKVLVLAYPGSGKSWIADHCENVSDFEFQHYRWDYGQYKHLPLEQLKGRKEIRTNNPEWPNNFFDALDQELNKRTVVLVPMATSLFERLNFLKNNGVRIIFAIQSYDCFDDMLNVFKARGNDDGFVEGRKNDFEKFHKIVERTNYEKVFIEKNEYLYDALVRVGIKFKPGKGFKNYL